MFTRNPVSGSGSRFQPRHKIRVGAIGDKTLWVDVDRFFAYVVDPQGKYDMYGIEMMRCRKETNDFVDAMWAMLVMRGYT